MMMPMPDDFSPKMMGDAGDEETEATQRQMMMEGM